MAPTGDGRGNSLSILDCPTTNAPTPATAKQEPEMSRPLWGKGDRVSGGRGELAYKHRLPQNFATKPNDCRSNKPHQIRGGIQKSMCKTKKPSPLGEGGRREPDGRGELASYLDCPITNAPTPTHHVNKTAPNPRGHTIPQASSPPPSPNGPTSHPKGEAKLLTVKPVQTFNPIIIHDTIIKRLTIKSQTENTHF